MGKVNSVAINWNEETEHWNDIELKHSHNFLDQVSFQKWSTVARVLYTYSPHISIEIYCLNVVKTHCLNVVIVWT